MTLDQWLADQLADLPEVLPPERAARLARLLRLGSSEAA